MASLKRDQPAGSEIRTWQGPATSSQSLVEAARAQLARMIDLKEFEIGVRLPSADVLARDLGVSRPIVLQALKWLEQEGRVSLRRGRAGVRVLDARGPHRQIRADWVLANVKAILDMTAARELVDPALARMAAESNARNALVRDLAKIHQSMLENQEGMEPWLALDIRFHWRIAEAASNEPLAELSLAARQRIAPAMDLIAPGRRPPSHAEHQELIDAIRDSAGERAASVAYQHAHTTTLKIRDVISGLRNGSREP